MSFERHPSALNLSSLTIGGYMICGPFIAAELCNAVRAQEYMRFCEAQATMGRKVPSKDEYWHARDYAYCIENPPAYPWWKSTLAAALTKLFKL